MLRYFLFTMLGATLGAPTCLAASLTITPDKQVYQVGEPIVLVIHGDAVGSAAIDIRGRLLFDADLAVFDSASQQPLTSFSGGFAWSAFALDGGTGFADAFDQFCCFSASFPVDGPLEATVVLQATSPGTLSFSWQTGVAGLPDAAWNLDFFGLTDAPGGAVTIIPEPGTGALVVLGLLALVGGRVRRRTRQH